LFDCDLTALRAPIGRVLATEAAMQPEFLG
jgi:hypothetical protein